MVIVVTCLYIKLPWPGDIAGIFWSSSQAATCPVPICLPHPVKASHCPLILLKVKQESCEYQFDGLWFNRSGSNLSLPYLYLRKDLRTIRTRYSLTICGVGLVCHHFAVIGNATLINFWFKAVTTRAFANYPRKLKLTLGREEINVMITCGVQFSNCRIYY